jgi:hypothetical protein
MTDRKIDSVTQSRCAGVNGYGSSPYPMVLAV